MYSWPSNALISLFAIRFVVDVNKQSVSTNNSESTERCGGLGPSAQGGPGGYSER